MRKKLKTDKSKNPVSLNKQEDQPRSSHKKPSMFVSEWRSRVGKYKWPILGILLLMAFIIWAWPSPLANSSPELVKVSATSQVLGNSSLGTVTREGPYGNTSSTYKVAYILGQHPRESRSHKAVKEAVINNSEFLK